MWVRPRDIKGTQGHATHARELTHSDIRLRCAFQFVADLPRTPSGMA